MVDLGMTPVLPAFTGFVPEAITRVAPNATVVRGSEWNGFGSTYSNDTFLEPDDPLFTTLQEKLVGIQKEVYGNVSSVYTLDQYNENTPFSGDTDYLRNISRDTMASLRAADPNAVWLMQVLPSPINRFGAGAEGNCRGGYFLIRSRFGRQIGLKRIWGAWKIRVR